MKRLAQLQPPPDVHSRIVSGSLARIEGRRSDRFAWSWAAAAFVVVAAVVALRPAVTSDQDVIVVQALPRPAFTIDAAADADVVTEVDDAETTELFLGRGRAHFEVVERRRGHFRVRTPAAVVEVVGTGFTVEAQGLCTTVTVTHGIVRVTNSDGTGDVRLTGSETETRCLPEDTVDGEAWVSEALELIAAQKNPARVIRLTERYRRLYPGGVLEEEALYGLTVAYVRSGRRGEARTVAKALVARHPASDRAREVTKWLGL